MEIAEIARVLVHRVASSAGATAQPAGATVGLETLY